MTKIVAGFWRRCSQLYRPLARAVGNLRRGSCCDLSSGIDCFEIQQLNRRLKYCKVGLITTSSGYRPPRAAGQLQQQRAAPHSSIYPQHRARELRIDQRRRWLTWP